MWATPQRSRWTRTVCSRPCTLSVPRITARAAFARASRLTGPDWANDCAQTAASARAIRNTEIDFFIADSLGGLACLSKFLIKAPRAYTTPRQDARALPLDARGGNAITPESGEQIDAPDCNYPRDFFSLALRFAPWPGPAPSSEGPLELRTNHAKRRRLFRNGCFELRRSRCKDFAPGARAFPDEGKSAAADG